MHDCTEKSRWKIKILQNLAYDVENPKYPAARLAILLKIAFFVIFWWFWALAWKLQNGLKIDLDVVETFWGQFWKAEIVYFPFLRKILKFRPFCNPNGILGFSDPKPDMDLNIPFWFQKGIKNWNFVDANIIFEKYGSSAFQNRSDHPYIFFRSNSMSFWSWAKSAKKEGGLKKKSSQFWGKKRDFGLISSSTVEWLTPSNCC